MKTIKFNDKEIKLKKDFLTRADSDGIIAYAMEQFDGEGIIKGLNFDYIALENSFFDALCLICVENFDDDIREEIYNIGAIDFLLDNIVNANRTYNKMYSIAHEYTSVGNILSSFVTGSLKKIPSSDEIEKLTNQMPELQSALDRYDHIVNGK